MMLPEILSTTTNKLLDNQLLNTKQIPILLNYLKSLSSEEYILPNVVMKKLDINEKQAYQVFSFLENLKIIEPKYMLYCHNCNTYQKYVFDNLAQIIGQEIHCAKCHEIINIKKSIIINYKVIPK